MKQKSNNLSNFVKYSSLAFEMIIIIGLGFFAGYKLDSWLDFSFPIFMLILGISFTIVAIYQVIRKTQQ